LLPLQGPRNSAAMLTDGYLAAANFGRKRRICRFRARRGARVLAMASATTEILPDTVVYSLRLEAHSPALLREAAVIGTRGKLRVDSGADGALSVRNLGREKTACEVMTRGSQALEMVLEPGEIGSTATNPA
jgi:hypothetical protein